MDFGQNKFPEFDLFDSTIFFGLDFFKFSGALCYKYTDTCYCLLNMACIALENGQKKISIAIDISIIITLIEKKICTYWLLPPICIMDFSKFLTKKVK